MGNTRSGAPRNLAGVRTHTVVESPIGDLTLLADDGVLAGLYMPVRKHPPRADALGERMNSGFENVAAQLAEYFAGARREFDIPLAASGTAFQRSVWKLLCTIPYGQTRSYGEIARELGAPTAVRAVAAANGRNPISIIVPCHRVIGSDGALVGYGGGLDRKTYLLHLEAGGGQAALF